MSDIYETQEYYQSENPHNQDENICKIGLPLDIINLFIKSSQEDDETGYTDYAYNIAYYILWYDRSDVINHIINNNIQKQKLLSILFIASAALYDEDKMTLFLTNNPDISSKDLSEAMCKVIYFFESSTNVVGKPDFIKKTLDTIKFLLDRKFDTSSVKEYIDHLMLSIKKLKKKYHGDDLKDMLEKKKVYLQILDMIK